MWALIGHGDADEEEEALKMMMPSKVKMTKAMIKKLVLLKERKLKVVSILALKLKLSLTALKMSLQKNEVTPVAVEITNVQAKKIFNV